jgi:hypothetical protein
MQLVVPKNFLNAIFLPKKALGRDGGRWRKSKGETPSKLYLPWIISLCAHYAEGRTAQLRAGVSKLNAVIQVEDLSPKIER